MVQPIMTSMGRNVKVLPTQGKRVLSETFKDKKGVTTIVTRVYDSKNRVLTTRMKRIFETVLKSGKRILTRQDEFHIQDKIAGTETPKDGAEFINKLFKVKDVLFSKDNNVLLKKTESYKKPCNSQKYIDKKKMLVGDKLLSETFYNDSVKVKEATRHMKSYTGKDVLKLPNNILYYNQKGLPKFSNNFDLYEFEIFNS